jgi:DNA-binding transcriptional MerR regulator
MDALGIGQLATRTRLASGYRRYGDLELARLRFIRRTQALGFTLREVKELLALSAQRDVGRVKRSAQAKLVDSMRVSSRWNAYAKGLRNSSLHVQDTVEQRIAQT